MPRTTEVEYDFVCKICGERVTDTWASHANTKHGQARNAGKAAAKKVHACNLGCGGTYTISSKLAHLGEFHHDLLTKHQKHAAIIGAGIGGRAAIEKHPQLRWHLRRWVQTHPIEASNIASQRFVDHPELRTLVKNAQTVWRTGNPEIVREVCRGAIRKRNLMFPDLNRTAGHLGGMKVALTGQVFRNSLGRQPIFHQGHFHRSLAENRFCQSLLTRYPPKIVHANVHFKGVEVDFIIGEDRTDISTWQVVIEYHAVRTWEGETKEGYECNRRDKLESLGVKCPIEVITV